MLRVKPFTTEVNGGQFNFACESDFTKPPFVLRIPHELKLIRDVRINDRMGRKLLQYVNPIFADAVNISGIVDLDCRELVLPLRKGHPDELKVTGTFALSQGRLGTSWQPMRWFVMIICR